MITAKLKNLRIAPRKVRLVANLIRGMKVEAAAVQLKFLPKRAARSVLGVLNSAVANAENSFGLSKENLFIDKITIDAGSTLKRWLPRAMGRATPIMKRTSHINIVLSQKDDLSKSKKIKPIKSIKKFPETSGGKSESVKAETGASEMARSVEKKNKKSIPQFERSEKIDVKKGNVKEIARKMFRRKSI